LLCYDHHRRPYCTSVPVPARSWQASCPT
jgi:hypothetical protein